MAPMRKRLMAVTSLHTVMTFTFYATNDRYNRVLPNTLSRKSIDYSL